MINYVNLNDLIKLVGNKELSEKYVNYLCGFKKGHQYRHDEIEAIFDLLKLTSGASNSLNNFLYGYSIPQLNKEFDLLAFGDDFVVNLELKSKIDDLDKVKKQLLANRHYLKMVSSNIFLCGFVKDTGKVYLLDDNGELSEIKADEIFAIIKAKELKTIDLDKIYTPQKILVSPLNSPGKFLKGEYLLTENQLNIKNEIILFIKDDSMGSFYGLTGSAGTGKTLLLYDIAKTLSLNLKIIIVHSGMLCYGHDVLRNAIKNISIIPAKDLRYKEIKDIDLIVVDEAHRLYESILEKIERWVIKAKKKCVFAYDEKQKMSNSENRRETMNTILELCGQNISKLTTKIRTNKEIALFITCLRDLSKFREEYTFKNVKIIFENDKQKAVNLAKTMANDGYTYISYTASFYNKELEYQKSDLNTHQVIGQEFDGVVMVMDENFYYEGRILKGKTHPNPDYIYTQLLYQGLTRTRMKLALIITDEALLNNVLSLFPAEHKI